MRHCRTNVTSAMPQQWAASQHKPKTMRFISMISSMRRNIITKITDLLPNERKP
jgi:hypothetical protein